MSSQAKERWERLAELGVKREIATPEGDAKMSEVILQLAEPLIKQHGKDAKRAKAIIALTVAGWNKSMFPADKQSVVEDDLIDCFVPQDGSAEAVGVVIHVMDLIADRREKLFPDLRKVIVDYEVDISKSQLTLSVFSAPLPDLDGKGE